MELPIVLYMEPLIQTSSKKDFHLLGFKSENIIKGSVKYLRIKMFKVVIFIQSKKFEGNLNVQ